MKVNFMIFIQDAFISEILIENAHKNKLKNYSKSSVQWNTVILFMNLEVEPILNRLKFQEVMDLPNIKIIVMHKQLKIHFKVNNY